MPNDGSQARSYQPSTHLRFSRRSERGRRDAQGMCFANRAFWLVDPRSILSRVELVLTLLFNSPRIFLSLLMVSLRASALTPRRLLLLLQSPLRLQLKLKLPHRDLGSLVLPRHSTTSVSTRESWTRSTKTSECSHFSESTSADSADPTDTSTTSTVWQTSSLSLTRPTLRMRLMCGAPTTTLE